MTTVYGERIDIQKKHHIYRKNNNNKKQEWIQINDSEKDSVALLSFRTFFIVSILRLFYFINACSVE